VLRLRRYERISVQNRRFRSNEGRLTQIFWQKGWPPPTILLLLRKLGKWSFVWCINLDRSLFHFVTIHAFVRHMDRQTDRQTEFSSLDRVCIPCSAGKEVSTSMGTIVHAWLAYLRVGFRFSDSFAPRLLMSFTPGRRWKDFFPQNLVLFPLPVCAWDATDTAIVADIAFDTCQKDLVIILHELNHFTESRRRVSVCAAFTARDITHRFK